ASTYGHSQLKTGHPVRSAIHKQLNGRLVLRWVTTWESLLLYVLLSTSPLFVIEAYVNVLTHSNNGSNRAFGTMAELDVCRGFFILFLHSFSFDP
ncbi:uncharacterized protein M437DRAFT_41565, partial [Aureobasidium melanogenum CBS 110374]